MKALVRAAGHLPCVGPRALRWLKYFLNALPIFGVAILYGWSYYGFIIVWVFSLFMNGYMNVGLVFFVVYHLLSFFTLWSYFRCIFSRPPFEIDQQTIEVPLVFPMVSQRRRILNYQDEEERICKSCQRPKPRRAHHCSWCERCVAKMDHHCPWLGNCVGAHNYKFFVLMLGYTVTFTFFIGITILIYTSMYQTRKVPVLYTLSAVGFAVGIGTGILFCFHLYLLFTNKTTIECGINLANCDPQHPYDRGWRANFKAVMGDDPLFWFIPVRPTRPVIEERITLSEYASSV